MVRPKTGEPRSSPARSPFLRCQRAIPRDSEVSPHDSVRVFQHPVKEGAFSPARDIEVSENDFATPEAETSYWFVLPFVFFFDRRIARANALRSRARLVLW